MILDETKLASTLFDGEEEKEEAPKEEFTGFIRPLNVEPRMPTKKVESVDVADEV